MIRKTNSRFTKLWQGILAAEKLTRGIVISTGVTGTSTTVIAGAPEPSVASNFINTKTPLGRGWDAEPGDTFTKVKAIKLKEVVGSKLLVNKLEELDINPTNNKIITRETLQKLLKDPEIKRVIEESDNEFQARQKDVANDSAAKRAVKEPRLN